ncbi:hypothetical protein LJK88_28150 [Paenibacillus sp. P26]|nr:hypothetical protein LJK88_28150 [Paenibacillus sp. P26]UUZ94792.1 hypothetical protein LJK87_09850 [Paenibacillus sp. P25]
MGTKFANIHVQTYDLEEIISYFKSLVEETSDKSNSEPIFEVKLSPEMDKDLEFSALLEKSSFKLPRPKPQQSSY